MKEENNENRQGFPDRKISETLIDFARPFVSIIDQDTTEEQVRSAFIIAITVWNAVVFDAVGEDHRYLDMLRQTLGEEYDNDPIIPELIARKQGYFADDMRAVGNHTVTD